MGSMLHTVCWLVKQYQTDIPVEFCLCNGIQGVKYGVNIHVNIYLDIH